jgi:hypothetical protein
LQGILFVLHTGIQWEWLPQELGFDSGMTCELPGAGTMDRATALQAPDLRKSVVVHC